MFSLINKDYLKVTFSELEKSFNDKSQSLFVIKDFNNNGSNNINGDRLSSLNSISGLNINNILLQTKTSLKKCKKGCQHGLCYDGECVCQNEYFGKTCSNSFDDEVKVGLFLFILIFIGCFILGAFLTWLIYYIIYKIFFEKKFEFGGHMYLNERWEQTNE